MAPVGLLSFQRRDSKLTIRFLVDIPADIMDMGYYLTHNDTLGISIHLVTSDQLIVVDILFAAYPSHWS